MPSPISSPTPTPTLLPTGTPTLAPTADTISPTVSITNPLNGATVKRGSTVTITASALDNVGVTKVEFSVNKTFLCTDTTAPYTCVWAVPGKRGITYTLTAKAYDAAGNTGTGTVKVTST